VIKLISINKGERGNAKVGKYTQEGYVKKGEGLIFYGLSTGRMKSSRMLDT
jgi:hypothetical protein